MARRGSLKKKVTFSLDGDVVKEMKELVATRPEWSQNQFVEMALQSHISRLRMEKLSEDYRRASRDPLFLADVDRVERDFAEADVEAMELIV